MNKIKLIASDLDGTLLTSQKEITPRLQKALTSIHEMGIFFVPSTGRHFAALPTCVKELPFLKYVITSNGAAVYDAEQKQNLFQSLLSAEAVEKTVKTVKGLPILTEFFIDGKAYISQDAYDNLSRYHLTDTHMKYTRATRIPLSDFWGALEKQKDILENINLVFSDMKLKDHIWQTLKETGLASVTASSEKNIEVTSLMATKAHALSHLCGILDIPRENVLALGDRDNDLPMLEFAGTGVAMENGEDHIKKVADFVTKSCDDFGAAIVLEQIIEKGELS